MRPLLLSCVLGCSLATAEAGEFCELDGLVPMSGNGGQEFGAGMAASGDTLMIGVPLYGVSNPEQGRVFIYERSGTDWVQVDVLQPPPEADPLWFGFSVDVDGDTAVVGAPRGEREQRGRRSGVRVSADRWCLAVRRGATAE